MQKETHADVALLQKRDFFADLPDSSGDVADLNAQQPDQILQQLLDRIVWKGDFLNLLYVPGSALQQALKQSKALDRKSTRLNSSHLGISYAVFCLKKK